MLHADMSSSLQHTEMWGFQIKISVETSVSKRTPEVRDLATRPDLFATLEVRTTEALLDTIAIVY